MKTRIILGLIAVTMLSSCAGKFGVMKRRYNKGFYVSVTKKAQQSEMATPKKTSSQKEAPVEVNVPSHSEPVQALASLSGMVKGSKALHEPERTVTVDRGIVASAGYQVNKTSEVRALPADLRKEAKKNARAMSDVNGVVLAILCIFLPPLAVFLFEKKLSINFWVDLLLTLLFFLPGIIFAFLVCFGGVSLG